MISPGQGRRLPAIDAIRGFAVLGILVMNIVAMGLPPYAYVDPHHHGGADGANLAAWAIAYVLADGKMRALFTMLFGASMLIAAERDGNRAAPHLVRMAWLFLFGMVHAWGFWFGDILVQYAVAGAILSVARRWPVRALLFAAACCFAVMLADDMLAWTQLGALKAAAALPDAPDGVIDAWAHILAEASPPPARIAREIALYRGGVADVFAARAPTTWMFQTVLLPLTLAETLGYAALGMALHRLGFFAGRWAEPAYRACVGAGVAAAMLTVPVAAMLVAARFDPATIPLADALTFLLRPWIALAYAAAIVLAVRSGRMRDVFGRLAAAGRMALSNYLGSTLIATTLFYGYGFGLYARLERAELYCVVAAIWLIILAWSQPWLDRFAYGPAEWLWRALTRRTLAIAK
ncbi:DUF418 domain-containing protein [Sphingomonas profundi]|uniref:DUF418 domain-containing protein n=1 Tax=Alterirhizorhabdus profundi TaxID=2681549 RepID=UPI0012E7E331|nr:DUF418 domain-containing protein [Sphingomonas profundi]